MKITKKQLKRIIKEEIENLLDDTKSSRFSKEEIENLLAPKQASVDDIQAPAATRADFDLYAWSLRSASRPKGREGEDRKQAELLPLIQKAIGPNWEIVLDQDELDKSEDGRYTGNQVLYLGHGDGGFGPRKHFMWFVAPQRGPNPQVKDGHYFAIQVRSAEVLPADSKAEEIPRDQYPGKSSISMTDEDEMLPLVQKAIGDTWEISHPQMPTWDRSKNQIVYLGRMNDHVFFKTSNDHRYFKLQVPDS